MVDPMALRCSLGSGCSEEPEGGPGEQAAGEKHGWEPTTMIHSTHEVNVLWHPIHTPRCVTCMHLRKYI